MPLMWEEWKGGEVRIVFIFSSGVYGGEGFELLFRVDRAGHLEAQFTKPSASGDV